MPRLEHNGPNFRYRVFWRPKGSTYWNNTYVLDENANELEINVNDIYGLYEIKVNLIIRCLTLEILGYGYHVYSNF
jgi:hypothetical protein